MRRKLNAPTSYDVARHAGVSQAVVSRAFQTEASIAEATRARVLACAEMLGYQPNAIARSLITKRSGLAGVLITEATQTDTPDVLLLLSRALLTQGLQPLLFPCTKETKGGVALDKAMSFGVDAIVSCVSLTTHDLVRAESRLKPVVLFNRHSENSKTLTVACDHANAARSLAARLVAAGNRRFAVVTGPSDAPVSVLRASSFVSRLKELGVKNIQVYEGDYHYESGQAAAMKLLGHSSLVNNNKRPEVVFCVNDAMALGLMDTARFELMMRIPSDVSVVGFDDIPAGQRPAYLLSTVRQPLEEMATVASLLLRQSLDEVLIASPQIVLPGVLVERGSAQLLPRPHL